MILRIFTDGACSCNPGPGGWASVISNYGECGEYKIISGNEELTTNNRMELMAVLKTLEHLMSGKVEGLSKNDDKIYIHSDSAYVVNAINDNWVTKWKVNKWKTSKGEDVKNKELWEELVSILWALVGEGWKIKLIKVKGHAGNVLNELADKEARGQSLAAKYKASKI